MARVVYYEGSKEPVKSLLEFENIEIFTIKEFKDAFNSNKLKDGASIDFITEAEYENYSINRIKEQLTLSLSI